MLGAVAALPCLYTGANQTTRRSLIVKGRKIGQKDDWIDIFNQVTKLLETLLLERQNKVE